MPNPDHRFGDSLGHFPSGLSHGLLALGMTVVGAVLITGGLTAGGIMILGARAWWSGWVAALLISLIASVISIAPLLLGICGGIQTAIAGFFAGMILRMLLMLGGAIAAIWVWHTPAKSTLLLAAPFYLAQLIAECAMLARAFWAKRPSAVS